MTRPAHVRSTSWEQGIHLLHAVAQIFNLPYRRIASCVAFAKSDALDFAGALPISNRRDSRLEICATPEGLGRGTTPLHRDPERRRRIEAVSAAAIPPPRQTRAAFLTRLGLGVMAVLTTIGRVSGADSVPPDRKGRRDSKVKRWDVITIGNLSRNRYWGESDARGVRSAICTCTAIQGEGFRLLVDPSLSNAEEMARELDRRTGLKLRDIDTVFITHEHGDHWFGLAHFPEAKWLASPEVAAALNKTKKLAKLVEAATGRIFDAVDIVPTPGHTLSHHSLRFDCAGVSVAVTGDAVATRDFWRERRGYFNSVDFELSARSMDRLSALADIIVPGHDNYFLNPDAAH